MDDDGVEVQFGDRIPEGVRHDGKARREIGEGIHVGRGPSTGQVQQRPQAQA